MWLNEIGIEIGYARLSHYTGQLKRRDQAAARAEYVAASLEGGCISEHSPSVPDDGAGKESTIPEKAAPPNDPLANIREREGGHPDFQYGRIPMSLKSPAQSDETEVKGELMPQCNNKSSSHS